MSSPKFTSAPIASQLSSSEPGTLRHWLTDESETFIDNHVAAVSMPHMGGGVGVRAEQSLSSQKVIARIPKRNIIYTGRARERLLPVFQAFAELEKKRKKKRGEGSEQASSMKSQWVEDCLRLDAAEELPMMAVQRLVEGLNPIECIVLYLILLRKGKMEAADAGLSFFWICELPPQYDNLLELGLILSSSDSATLAFEKLLHEVLPIPRYATKVHEEICRWWSTFEKIAPLIEFIVERYENGKREKSDNENKSEKSEDSPTRERKGTSDTMKQGHSKGKKEEENSPSSASLFPAHRSLVHLFLWAYNTIMSRGFSFDEDIWALMPWVDYFNYSTKGNIFATYNHRLQCYEFLTKKRIEQRGTELLLTYGHYNDFELSLWYGFTLCARCCVDVQVDSPLFQGGREGEPLSSPSSRSNANKSQPKKHQDCCSLAFTPLADPNGNFDYKGGMWIVELFQQTCDLIALLHSFYFLSSRKEEEEEEEKNRNKTENSETEKMRRKRTEHEQDQLFPLLRGYQYENTLIRRISNTDNIEGEGSNSSSKKSTTTEESLVAASLQSFVAHYFPNKKTVKKPKNTNTNVASSNNNNINNDGKDEKNVNDDINSSILSSEMFSSFEEMFHYKEEISQRLMTATTCTCTSSSKTTGAVNSQQQRQQQGQGQEKEQCVREMYNIATTPTGHRDEEVEALITGDCRVGRWWVSEDFIKLLNFVTTHLGIDTHSAKRNSDGKRKSTTDTAANKQENQEEEKHLDNRKVTQLLRSILAGELFQIYLQRLEKKSDVHSPADFNFGNALEQCPSFQVLSNHCEIVTLDCEDLLYSLVKLPSEALEAILSPQ